MNRHTCSLPARPQQTHVVDIVTGPRRPHRFPDQRRQHLATNLQRAGSNHISWNDDSNYSLKTPFPLDRKPLSSKTLVKWSINKKNLKKSSIPTIWFKSRYQSPHYIQFDYLQIISCLTKVARFSNLLNDQVIKSIYQLSRPTDPPSILLPSFFWISNQWTKLIDWAFIDTFAATICLH